MYTNKNSASDRGNAMGEGNKISQPITFHTQSNSWEAGGRDQYDATPSNSQAGRKRVRKRVRVRYRPHHINPSTKAYRDKRAAVVVIEKHGAIPEECLSEKQVASLNWARGVLETSTYLSEKHVAFMNWATRSETPTTNVSGSDRDDSRPSNSEAAESSEVQVRGKHIAPSTKAYRIKHDAFKVINRVSSIPEQDWTERDFGSLNWARGRLLSSKNLSEKHAASLNWADDILKNTSYGAAEKSKESLSDIGNEVSPSPWGSQMDFNDFDADGSIILATSEDTTYAASDKPNTSQEGTGKKTRSSYWGKQFDYDEAQLTAISGSATKEETAQDTSAPSTTKVAESVDLNDPMQVKDVNHLIFTQRENRWAAMLFKKLSVIPEQNLKDGQAAGLNWAREHLATIKNTPAQEAFFENTSSDTQPHLKEKQIVPDAVESTEISNSCASGTTNHDDCPEKQIAPDAAAPTEISSLCVSGTTNHDDREASTEKVAAESTAPKKKNISASTKAYRERRSAVKLIEKLGAIPEKELSETQVASLNWARNLFESFKDKYTSNATTTKRQVPLINTHIQISKKPKLEPASPPANDQTSCNEATSVSGTTNRVGCPEKQIAPDAATPTDHDDREASTVKVAAESTARKKKNISASTKAYRERRSAVKLIEKLGAIPEKELSETQAASLNWARNLFESFKDKYTSNATTTKRQVPLDKNHVQISKKPKLQPASPPADDQTSCNEATKGSQILAVIDRNNRGGAITRNNWKCVEMRLLGVYMGILRRSPGPPPTCRDAGWTRGRVKLVECADERSAELYVQAIAAVGEVWPGAALEAVTKDKIPDWHLRYNAVIPAEPSAPEEILELIQLSNPSLQTDNWRVVKVSEAPDLSKCATIVINDESIVPLADLEGILSYGFTAITLKNEPVEGLHQPTDATDVDMTRIKVEFSDVEYSSGAH